MTIKHYTRITIDVSSSYKNYEASVYDLIEGRLCVRDSIKEEIDKLVSLKEHEEATRKVYKTKLTEANLNYTTYRN
ncbi:unnamed protein product [Rhizopus stolonifer]